MPKVWKPGTAKLEWQVDICRRDAAWADDVTGKLIYLLTDAGADTSRGLTEIERMTGAEIVKALKDYKSSALQSIENGVRARG